MLRRIRAAAYVVAVLAVVLIPFALFGSLVEGWAAAAGAPDVSRVLVGLAVFGMLAADILRRSRPRSYATPQARPWGSSVAPCWPPAG